MLESGAAVLGQRIRTTASRLGSMVPYLIAGLVTLPQPCRAEEPVPLGRWRQTLALSAGYGWGHELGGSHQDAPDSETVPILPRWAMGLTNVVGGDAFYRGNLEISVEGVFLVDTEPRSGSALGGAAGLRYNFVPSRRIVPYIGAGAGVLDLDYDLRSQRDGFNFVIFCDVGLHAFVGERVAVSTGYRLQHISNADTRSPNFGIDTSFLLLGVTYFLQ